MSYILDALRKSEQERQLTAGKSASVMHTVMVEAPRVSMSRLLMAGIAAGSFVIAGLAFWLMRSHPPAPSGAAPVARTAETAAPPTQASPIPVAPPAPMVPPVESPVRGAPSPAPVVAAMPAVEPKVPESKKEELPPINIMGYVRDGEQGGVAMINDKLVREGEEFAPGLRLEKILPDGAVFNFKGRRFTR
jgi:general secretion pathway protein B